MKYLLGGVFLAGVLVSTGASADRIFEGAITFLNAAHCQSAPTLNEPKASVSIRERSAT